LDLVSRIRRLTRDINVLQAELLQLVTAAQRCSKNAAAARSPLPC
jgi:hypothetical protein